MTREDILRALRDEFRENTRARLTEMSSILDELARVPDPARLRELERHFHGLAGLGGTYGYQSVTTLSREGEDLCGDALDTPGTAADLTRLTDIVAGIASEIRQVPGA